MIMAYISVMSFKAAGLQCDLQIYYKEDYFFPVLERSHLPLAAV